MNGDSRKPEIAAAQNYFAVKTREAELAPQTSELLAQLLERVEQQSTVIEEQGKAIAQLQSQIQNILPPSTDFIPPGWNAEVWRQLSPQDKRHFRYIFRRRNFRPSGQGKDKSLALPAATTQQIQHKQRTEVQQLIGEVSPEEQERFRSLKARSIETTLVTGRTVICNNSICLMNPPQFYPLPITPTF
jgi:DNA-damage-inducible protein D